MVTVTGWGVDLNNNDDGDDDEGSRRIAITAESTTAGSETCQRVLAE